MNIAKSVAVPVLNQKINWFPGHMHKTLKELETITSKVDIFLEIRDARLPYSTRNQQFDSIIKKAQKHKIIIFNKYELCDRTKTDRIIEDYKKLGIDCVGMSAKTHQNMKELAGRLKSLSIKYKTVGTWMMVCGMPNVGKSTIINQFRAISDLENKRATNKATASVCTTKAILNGIKMNEEPLLYLMDSPGVMIPSNISDEIGLKLGLLGIVKDIAVEKNILIEYFFNLLKDNPLIYSTFKMKTRPKDHDAYMLAVRERMGMFNYDAAYDQILLRLREGKFGNLTLDQPQIH